MTTVRLVSYNESYGLPGGVWRWVALGLFLTAVAVAGLVIAMPQDAGWLGVGLVAGLGAMAALVFYAIWPRASVGAVKARHVAEAATRANVAWAVTNPDGAVIHCNDAYRQIAGVRGREAPPPPQIALGAESAAAMLYRLNRRAIARESHEETFALAEGFEILGAVRPLSEGRTGWWFTPRIVTPKAHSPTADAAHERVPVTLGGHTALVQEAPIGIAIAERDGTIREANRPFREFFAAAGEIKDRPLQELAPTSEAAAIGNALARAEANSNIVLTVHTSGERLAEIHLRPLSRNGGLALYLIDVSEQKALETKFAQSQKMQAVGQLAGGVAHDFNNLLTVIIGNCEFLLMRHTAGDPSFREINEVHQNALRAATLVGQLLAFSRKQTLQPRVLKLRDAVGELAQLLRRLLREGIELKLEHGPDLWSVHADETQISNALINLVVNARDAMPKGGTVTISTNNEKIERATALASGLMPPGEYVRIEVRDTGIGIPKENVEKIFDPFFTTKPVGQGTGLGLATVYGIIRQTGGFLGVASEVGRGTVFRIYLPRYQGEVIPAVVEPPPPRDITGQDTILLVEDEEAVRSFAARALKLRGYQVLEAAGGEEALELVRRHAGVIHLLITDVVMPNMDGPTLVRAVRRLRPDMAVIFMSGYAEEAFRRHDENAAELHFLAKPFGLKQLAAKVKDVLSRAPENVNQTTTAA
ncbi:MAG TPA: ATP-binding protein [Rhizomicrobium sp.]|jgi:signal transduction histidine kinase/ActR/RegA family two-component response regulator|nr:ATP-binding protein [Rhizomicrobium sp.]